MQSGPCLAIVLSHERDTTSPIGRVQWPPVVSIEFDGDELW